VKLDYELSSLECEVALVLAEDLAKPFESCRLAAYHDPIGFPTQGWGHLLSRTAWEDLSKYPDWSQAHADEILSEDLRATSRAVSRLLKVPLQARAFAALIDFAFNLGAGNLQASTLLRHINRGDFDSAAPEFMRWNKAGGRILRGLTRRRAAERDMFLSGI
jgi:lysozyme